MIAVEKIKINYEDNPIGVMWDNKRQEGLQIGWIMESSLKNVEQTAYQLQISSDSSFDDIVFESGKVEDSRSLHVTPNHMQLKSAHKYYVRVRVWARGESKGNKCCIESEFSNPACFVTALLANEQWKGAFVSAETPEDAGNSKGTYVQNEFTVTGKIAEAYAYATALGLYKLSMNGQKVSDDILTPGWTSYQKHLLYQTYDVTDYLQEGENQIRASLGAGWYKGKMGFKHNRNNYGTQTAFALHMLIRYEDGREQLFVTDKNWTGKESPITFAEIYDGETYDARKETIIDAEAGKTVSVIPFDNEVLEAQTSCRVKEHEKFSAKNIFVTQKGEVVVDFGQNMSAWVHVSVHGKPGDIIELKCFETLDKNGNVYTDNLRTAKQTLRYIFGQEKTVEYHPSFTYMGFRYVQIISFPGTPIKENFCAYAVYSNMEPTGELSCSNPELNQLCHNILWGMKSNFVDIPSDCPQRDERMGWTGDAQIFCGTASFFMNTYPFFTKWLKDLAADQTIEGGVPHVVPDIISNSPGEDWLTSQGSDSAAAWADSAIIIPWKMYLYYGDIQILKNQFESMKAWIDFMKCHAVDYIWNYRLQFGDWVALDAEEGSYFGATPNDLTCTAYFAYATRLFVKILKVLIRERPELEKLRPEYENLYQHILEKFQKTFFTSDGRMTAQTQTAHIIALYFELAPAEYKEQLTIQLKKLLEEQNGHLVTGFVGTPYFCYALSENHALEEAYRLLLQRDFPSWLYQITMGATTVWEHWDGIKPDGSMWSADMNSLNHYAYGAIGEWMINVMAGLQIDENNPGFSNIIIHPQPGGNLTNVKLNYLSQYGKIEIIWEKREEMIEVEVQIPVNTTAEVRLNESGKSGKSYTSRKIGSGNWKFTYLEK